MATTHVDDHHTVEDVGICLGQALRQAVGDKKGITRYGSMTLPMEETLVTSAVDLSGRFWFVDAYEFPTEKIGQFDTQLVEVFWQAMAANALMNLHLLLHHGRNSHHIAEGFFKATAGPCGPRSRSIPGSRGCRRRRGRSDPHPGGREPFRPGRGLVGHSRFPAPGRMRARVPVDQ